MAPNRRARKDDGHGGGGGPPAGNNQRNNGGGRRNGMASTPLKCPRPKGCLDPKRLIYMEDIESGGIDVVRVTCNNLQCDQGNYMHSECFNDWETGVLNFLSSTGRARSWSVKQRQQNLWTKKGYDLAFKACDCNCGKGHLRKDLDWVSPTEKPERDRPPRNNVNGNNNNPAQEDVVANQNQNQNQNHNGVVAVGGGGADKKKKKKVKEALPILSLSAPVPHPNDNQTRSKPSTGSSTTYPTTSAPIKALADPPPLLTSQSLSSGIGSPGSDHSESPSPPTSCGHWNVPDSKFRDRVNSVSSNASGSSGAYSGASGSPPSPEAQFGSPICGASMAQALFKFQQRKNSSGGVSDRIRHNSTGTAFARRSDFSVFNVLPKIRRNSYNIKVDDDGHGNDDMRSAVLQTLQNHRMTKVNCCMCQMGLTIYDRYPLVDGTFFISPRKYCRDSVPMNSTPVSCVEGNVSNTRYLTAVCMNCLQGRNGGFICRSCGKAFDTSAIIIGAVYGYDIFATMTCCPKRVECINCRAPLHPDTYRYFFQASSLHRCMRCGYVDFHFAKPLDSVYQKLNAEQYEIVYGRQMMEERLALMKNTTSLQC